MLEEKLMLFLWSFLLQQQNSEQHCISASDVHCLAAVIAMRTCQECKQVPQIGGHHKMKTSFSAQPRNNMTCIAPALDVIPETMGCHMRKVWHWEWGREG